MADNRIYIKCECCGNQLLAYKLVTKRDQMTIEDLEVSEE